MILVLMTAYLDARATFPLTRRIPPDSYPGGTFYETFNRIQLEEGHGSAAFSSQTDDMHPIKLEMI